jgi:hypothetical protein
MGGQKTILFGTSKSMSGWASALLAMSNDVPESWDPIQRFYDYTFRMPEPLGNKFSLANSASRPVSSTKS